MKKKAAKAEEQLQFPEMANVLAKLFPDSGKVLLTGGGKEFVERIGVEAIRSAVLSVMSGENLRTQTEPISRRRIAQVSGAVIAMFTKGFLTIPDFQTKLSGLAIDQLKTAKGNSNVWPAQWVIGLTGKQVQNVLRSDPKQLLTYVAEFERAIADAAKHCAEQVGDYRMCLGYIEDGTGQFHEVGWDGIARITTAIGAQTLAIRGSDKSMYGKLFEKLVLGSVLTLLGFKRVDRKNNKQTNGVFWLSDSSDNRESDATVIVSPGKIARFDIGFIGPGNPEISKDKLSRFGNLIVEESQAEYGSSSVTFVIVDRLPQTGKTKAAAEKAGAEIIQMSMQYWPKELGLRLKERFGFEHEILNVTDQDLQTYIRQHLDGIQVQEFLSGISVEEIADETTDLDNAEVLEDE